MHSKMHAEKVNHSTYVVISNFYNFLIEATHKK